MKRVVLAVIATAFLFHAAAATVTFNTGNPDALLAAASRPSSAGKIEIESGDDFILNSQSMLTSATFTGLVTGVAPQVGQVVVEIYRIFPLDSVNPPSGSVPTRVNSPSDDAFDSRTSGSDLSFSTQVLNATFTAANSVLNGINKIPNQKTGGEGSVTGMEVRFTVNFTTPLSLPADHYFFVPQVMVNGGEFYWLSSPRPITGGTGPFNPDLQAWIRNANLDPDWLRIGTDIVGAGAFNMAFSLAGTDVPEPSTFGLLLAGAGWIVWKRHRA
jgi:hypothetical protein